MHTWSGLVASTAAHDAEVFLCFWHLEMSLSCISTALRFTLTKKKKQRSSSSIVVRSQCVRVCARARGLRYFPTSAQVTLLTWDH